MSEWTKPEFVEIRMDAEINCYSSAIDLNAKLLPLTPATRDSALADRRQESSPS